MSESTKHDAIYLQVCDDEDSEWLGHVTWCQDRVHESDVKYIRADLVESLRQQLDAALAAIKVKDAFIEKVAKQTPEKPDYWSSCSQCGYNSSEAEDLLAIQPDDSALQAFAEKVRDQCARIIEAQDVDPSFKHRMADAIRTR